MSEIAGNSRGRAALVFAYSGILAALVCAALPAFDEQANASEYYQIGAKLALVLETVALIIGLAARHSPEGRRAAIIAGSAVALTGLYFVYSFTAVVPDPF